ncbi:MAG: family 78 glycoside hydrolase catalytic domain [Clostridia bacterium]|nr:family 78 glycoside hydrolase catalytic domain [Clostridia bacterium]
MKQKDVFKNARWISPASNVPGQSSFMDFSVLRVRFELGRFTRVTLKVIGFGFFTAYVNGSPVTDKRFLPLSTDYAPRENYPSGETLSGHRVIVPVFDVTSSVREGGNVLAVHFGGGWYTFPLAKYGDPRIIYLIEAENGEETTCFVSGGPGSKESFFDSFVKDYCFTTHETHDYRGFDDAVFGEAFDESENDPVPAAVCPDLDTEYVFSECPADKAVETVCPKAVASGIRRGGDGDSGGVPFVIYDVGRNTTGIPKIKCAAPCGSSVTVSFSEALAPDGSLDMRFSHKQRFSFISDGAERIAAPWFTWFGFRYFEVTGDAEAGSVEIIHADVRPSGHFKSGSAVLNWIYETFLNTQLSNMHAGIPSDCPHIERRGYTGDGELVCHAAMSTLDAKEFYRKWIDDISDCQDIHTGHVQYTAPYIRSGGGPGAWGCAIVEVPYRFYKEYGDPEPARKLFPQMLRYFDFLEEHSYMDIVVSDKAGEWCLGDWCTLTETALPAGFVNNYYYIRSLDRARELALVFGDEKTAAMLFSRMEARVNATVGAYYNTWDCNFLANIQGANAFAVDLGLGNRHTLEFMLKYYRELGRYDTGICGTDVLTRVLFETGNGDLALDLLTGSGAFSDWMNAGFTTFSEYWLGSTRERSRNHPMFGSVVAYLFQFLLGITQPGDSYGYESLVIRPFISLKAGNIEGSRMLPCGEVSVKYDIVGSEVRAKIVLPGSKTAEFEYKDFRRRLVPGENVFSFDM